MGIFMGVLQISCDRHARMTDISTSFPVYFRTSAVRGAPVSLQASPAVKLWLTYFTGTLEIVLSSWVVRTSTGRVKWGRQ